MNLAKIPSVAQMRLAAKAKLPQPVFDFIDGGADDEETLRLNVDAFNDYRFTPCVLNDVSQRRVGCHIFEKPAAMPVMISPTGLAALAWPGGEALLARAAKSIGIPIIVSTSSSVSIEDVAATGIERRWFQLYVLRDREITVDLLQRAQNSGYEALVVTVDVPVVGKRERDVLNGFTVPLNWSARNLWEFARHPQWTLNTLKAGVPAMCNLTHYSEIDTDSVAAHAAWVNRAFDPSATWKDLATIRAAWQGKLLIKGILTLDDAQRAVDAGVDGLIISNHGGRQLDGAIAAVHALDTIANGLEGAVPLILDSGVRRGTDIVKALCLGATAVSVGRATLYGAAAGGEAGIARTLQILHDEIDRALALLGVDDVGKLDRSFLDSAH